MDKKEIISLLDEVFREAEKGEIIVDKAHSAMVYRARFFTNIEGSNKTKNSSCPTLIIHSQKDFIEKIQKYLEKAIDFYKSSQEYYDLNDRDFNKFLITCLIINAAQGDFNNFSNYVENRTNQIDGGVLKEFEKIKDFEGSELVLKTEKLKPNLEAPYKATFSFEGADEKFVLPSILYGVSGNKATIYAVQNMAKEQKNKLSKKLDRYFRKVNKGTLEQDYITEVSPNAVVALTLFIGKMKECGVEQVEAPCIMPLRHQTAVNRAHALSNKFLLNKKDRKDLIADQERIAASTTEKFSYLFMRYAHHFKGTDFYYDAENEKVVLTFHKESVRDDNIIFDIEDFVR